MCLFVCVYLCVLCVCVCVCCVCLCVSVCFVSVCVVCLCVVCVSVCVVCLCLCVLCVCVCACMCWKSHDGRKSLQMQGGSGPCTLWADGIMDTGREGAFKGHQAALGVWLLVLTSY